MITSSSNPEEETKMIKKLMSKLFGNNKVTVESQMTKQAAEIAKVMAQLDTLAGKAGN